MVFKNYYSILGISPNATQVEIKRAYIEMAKKWHPDTNFGLDSTAKMQAIIEAYEILKDKETRKLYNIEYYKNFLVESKDKPNPEIKTQNCYYCGKNMAKPEFVFKETFYKVTERTVFPQRKVWYNTIDIKIPRCENCYKTHNSGTFTLLLIPFISFAILGLILGLTIWELWLLFLIVGGIFGLIMGGILITIESSIIAQEAGIKNEKDFSEFEPIVNLKREDWSTIKPEA